MIKRHAEAFLYAQTGNVHDRVDQSSPLHFRQEPP